tara:strand:- start:6367 stop:6954 length:588 start_codon:yes stop_codon:yes gene_type:complete
MINIIQLGSNTGLDHVTDFIKEYRSDISKILLVEPIPIIANQLLENYKDDNVIVHACAISNKNGTADLTYIPGSNLRLSSLISNVHSDFSVKETSTIAVPTLTFDSLCAKHNLQQVDVLFIDTEGYDENIIATIDLKKYNIKTLVWEHFHALRINPEQHKLIKQQCRDNNMEFEVRGANIIATKQGTIKYNITLI